jgi:Tfp pilus assembly protein PilN
MALFKKRRQENRNDKRLKNPKILEVNLIKEETQLSFNWRRNGKALLFALGVTIFIIIEIYFGLDWWRQDEEARLEGLKAEIKTVSQEVADMRELAKDALAYQKKTVEISELLDDHIYWTNFFSWLEKNTLSTVSYGEFSGDIEGEYNLKGIAGSFAEVSWQAKQLLGAPFVKKVQILNAATGGEITKEDLEAEAAAAQNQEYSEESKEPSLPPGVSFELVLEIDQQIFKK